MDVPSYSTEASRSGSESTERRGRSSHTVPRHEMHKPPSMVAHLSPLEIEEQILQSAELAENHAAVLLYLRLDIWLLESIFALRMSGSEDLAGLHPSLFDSPPESLFNRIYTLRHFPGLDLAGTIAKVETIVHASRSTDSSREPKVAPRGQAYGCPSKHCKKAFIKSGHAVNHVEKQHPEYLKLHPSYQPSQFMVEDLRSHPASPELERRERRRSTSKQHELRPHTLTSRTDSSVSEGLSVYFNDGTGGAMDRPSPRIQEYDSQGDSDEAPRNVPFRGLPRNKAQASMLHPLVSQEQHQRACANPSRYQIPSRHFKRGRELASPSESVAMEDQLDERAVGRFRQHAKRRSIVDCY